MIEQILTLLCLPHLKPEMRFQSKSNHDLKALKKAEGFCKEHHSFEPAPKKVLRSDHLGGIGFVG